MYSVLVHSGFVSYWASESGKGIACSRWVAGAWPKEEAKKVVQHWQSKGFSTETVPEITQDEE